MHRRRVHSRSVTVGAAAAFAICAAFAAQPTSLRADWGGQRTQLHSLWVPGSATPMSAYDPDRLVLMPPR
jgi:hypothetical protein